MSEYLEAVLPWLLVPGVLLLASLTFGRTRWGGGDPARRFLKVLVSGTLMMSFTIPAVGGLLDDIASWRGLRVLVCDLFALYFSRQAALAIWETTRAPRAGALNLTLTITSLLGAGAMTVAWLLVGPDGAGIDTLNAASVRTPASIFWIAFCLAHILNIGLATGRSLQARFGRRIRTTTRDRLSLTWWLVSCISVLAYIAVFPPALLALAMGRPDAFVVQQTNLLQAIPGATGLLGGALCAATWADLPSRVRHLLLRPAWRWLTETEDDLVLRPLLGSAGPRLSRRSSEMHQAADRLARFATPEQRARVGQLLGGRARKRPELTAAVIITLGRRARRSQEHPHLHATAVVPVPHDPWFLLRCYLRRKRAERIVSDLEAAAA